MDLLNNRFGLSVLLILVVLEYLWSVRKGLANFSGYETLSSLALIGMDKFLSFVSNPTDKPPELFSHLRVFEVHWSQPYRFIVLFFVVDFFYYWSHRYSHYTQLGWASHIMHHSPTKYNMGIANRVGITRLLSLSWLVFIPVAALGFDPGETSFILGVNLLFQLIIHTELIPKLGWFDKVFNSPSNHRVHHSSNPAHYNCNMGGVLMLWDHIFGTYCPEPEARDLQYGMPELMGRKSIVLEIFAYWMIIWRQLVRARSGKEILIALWGRPHRLEISNSQTQEVLQS